MNYCIYMIGISVIQYTYFDFRLNEKLYFTEFSDDNIYYETIIYYLMLSLHNAKFKYR